MITGQVRDGDARIHLRLVGRRGRKREIDAVVDTGYTGCLALPPDLIVPLGLPWHTMRRGVLADGSICLFDVFKGDVVWDGHRRRILIDEADTDPLVGMALLNGFELNVQVRPRGKVTIKRLR